MKKIYLFVFILCWVNMAVAQNLVTVSSDFVGFTEFPTSPYLVQSGPEQFYWISSSSYSFMDHPLLNEISIDHANVFFIKYDMDGKPLHSKHIRGSSDPLSACAHGGGLLLLTSAFEDVDASGTEIPINNEGEMEVLAWYDGEGQLVRLASLWNLGPDQYVNSKLITSDADGSVYIYGTNKEPLAIRENAVIGEQWTGGYFYLLKYSSDLIYQWSYTAGFETAGADNFVGDLAAFPDVSGNVWVSGSYESVGEFKFTDEILEPSSDATALFLVRLTGDGNQEWVLNGGMGGFSSGTYLDKGFPMKNGDMVFTGVTTTGYFQLGEADFSFEGPGRRANYFAYRMRQDGTMDWSTTYNAAGRSFSEEKKGAKDQMSSRFEEDFMFDATSWNNRVLYLAGSYLSDSFEVAGEPLPKKYEQGLFVSAVNMETGEQEWGYGLSSLNSCLNGFDTDASGNVTVMGCTEGGQQFDEIGEDNEFDGKRFFLLGLDFTGKPLWYNNALSRNYDYSLNGVDLEVLESGAVFSSFYQTQMDNLELGGSTLDSRNYSYASWLISLKADNELGGQVLDATGSPVYPGVVNAYKTSRSGAYPLVSTIALDQEGRYLFAGLYPSRYTLQVVPNRDAYPEFIPTYLGNGERWNVAQFNDFETNTRASFLNIDVTRVPALTPGDGSGAMSGSIVYEEEGARKSTLARPVRKASVLVVEKTKKSTMNEAVIAYVETDDLGNFQFENVPDGQYDLIVDITGLEMVEVHDVTIESDVVVEGLDYTVGEDGIYTFTGVGIPRTQEQQLRIYPVPGNGMIHLEIPDRGNFRVEVFGADGRMVVNRQWNSTARIRTLDISDHPPGIYLIRLKGPDTFSTARYLKR